MQNLQKQLQEVIDVLKSTGFKVKVLNYPYDRRRRSVDVIASDGKKDVLMKIVGDVNELRSSEVHELKALSSTLKTSSLIIASKISGRDLEDYVAYEKYGMYVITSTTFKSIVKDKENIYVYYSRGGFYVKVNPREFRRARIAKGMSLGELGRLLGVTRKAVYEYEKGEIDISIERAERVIEILGEDVLEPVDIFEAPKAKEHTYYHVISSERIIMRHLRSLGYDVCHAERTVVDLAALKEQELKDQKLAIIVEHDRRNGLLIKAIESEKLEEVMNVKRYALVNRRSMLRELEDLGIEVARSPDELREQIQSEVK